MAVLHPVASAGPDHKQRKKATLSLACVAMAGAGDTDAHLAAGFAGTFSYGVCGGVAAAVLQRSRLVRAGASSPWAYVVVLACLAAVAVCYDPAYSAALLALLTAAFTLVASGASVFGLLTLAASRLLGELTYGIYVLHGLLFFVLFRFVMGFEVVAQLSPEAHCAGVCAAVAGHRIFNVSMGRASRYCLGPQPD